jgi:hypothetical protein
LFEAVTRRLEEPSIEQSRAGRHSSGDCWFRQAVSSGNHANFEVVVPVRLANNAIELRHFFHDNSNVSLPWRKAQFVMQSCDGWGCVCGAGDPRRTGRC